MKVVHLLGIAGVSENETAAARVWASRLEWPMVGVALWIVLQWYLEETGGISHAVARIADWLVWLAFLLETVVLTAQVRDKRRYLLGNWLNLLIITAGFPYFWQYAPLIGMLRSARLLRGGGATAAHVRNRQRKLLSQHRLGTTLIVVLFHHAAVRHHHVARRPLDRRRVGWHVVGLGDHGYRRLRRCGAAHRCGPSFLPRWWCCSVWC